jgi:hypothetical protein
VDELDGEQSGGGAHRVEEGCNGDKKRGGGLLYGFTRRSKGEKAKEWGPAQCVAVEGGGGLVRWWPRGLRRVAEGPDEQRASGALAKRVRFSWGGKKKGGTWAAVGVSCWTGCLGPSPMNSATF